MSYESLLEKNRNEGTKYDTHHLIARGALNQYKNYLKYKGVQVPDWLDDDVQRWAPALLLPRKHHMKTPSYYNPEKMSIQQLARAAQYINEQADLLKQGKFMACLDMEISLLDNIFKGVYSERLKQATEYLEQFLHQHELPEQPAQDIDLKTYVDAQVTQLRAQFKELIDVVDKLINGRNPPSKE